MVFVDALLSGWVIREAIKLAETVAKRHLFAPSIAAYSQMLIYYLINSALLLSLRTKTPFFARGLKLCKTLLLFEFAQKPARGVAFRALPEFALRADFEYATLVYEDDAVGAFADAGWAVGAEDEGVFAAIVFE